MKKLIILSIILTACNSHNEPKQLKFHKLDEVLFEVPTFYNKVCSGNGKIDDFISELDGTYQYKIITPIKENGCPYEFIIREELIKGK